MSYDLTKRATGDFIVNNGGVFQRMKRLAINDELGVAKRVTRMWVNDEGIWRAISWNLPRYELTITGDENQFDLYAALASQDGGALVDPISAFVDINSDATIFSDDNLYPALYASDTLPAGSTLKITNRGMIAGKGGDGWGQLGKTTEESEVLAQGGVAFEVPEDLIFDNADGKIYGGGGGGDSGFTFSFTYNINLGGGGGQGVVQGLGGASSSNGPGIGVDSQATDGTLFARGAGATGHWSNGTQFYAGDGGDWGDDGHDNSGMLFIGVKGLGGPAIQRKGHTITWVDEGDIRGARIA